MLTPWPWKLTSTLWHSQIRILPPSVQCKKTTKNHRKQDDYPHNSQSSAVQQGQPKEDASRGNDKLRFQPFYNMEWGLNNVYDWKHSPNLETRFWRFKSVKALKFLEFLGKDHWPSSPLVTHWSSTVSGSDPWVLASWDRTQWRLICIGVRSPCDIDFFALQLAPVIVLEPLSLAILGLYPPDIRHQL